MNNIDHPSHNSQPERPAPYDYNAPFDEFDRRVTASTQTTRNPELADAMARARASHRRRQHALSAVAIGLAALIALGGLLAITGRQSGAGRVKPTGESGGQAAIDEVMGITDDPSVATLVVTIPDQVTEQPTTSMPTAANPAAASSTDTAAPAPTPGQATPTQPVPPPVPDPVAPTPHRTTNQTARDAPPLDATPGDVRTGHDHPVVFIGRTFIGYWEDGGFVSANSGSDLDWLADTEIELRNHSGATVVGAVVECNGQLQFNGNAAGALSIDGYWYSDNAPFTVSGTNTDDGEQQMISLLAEGIPVDQIDSYGAALAADGSADRLVWGLDDYGTVNWIATFDIETNQFRTVRGEAGAEPTDTEISEPNGVWTDLDNDGNLESIYTTGDVWSLKEWATGSEIWAGSPYICSN